MLGEKVQVSACKEIASIVQAQINAIGTDYEGIFSCCFFLSYFHSNDFEKENLRVLSIYFRMRFS